MPDARSKPASRLSTAYQQWHRLALGVNIVLVLVILALLPLAVRSMQEVLGRGPDELALGIGGIILGVWSVRSVLMPQSVSTITAIDLALSWLILLLLLGLALRAALHFHRHSDLPILSLPWQTGGRQRRRSWTETGEAPERGSNRGS